MTNIVKTPCGDVHLVGRVVVESSALESIKAMCERLQAERDELLAAAQAVIASRDAYTDRLEIFVKGGLCDYWSPHASMVESEAIAKVRSVIAKCTQEQS